MQFVMMVIMMMSFISRCLFLRVRLLRKSLTRKPLFPQNISTMRKCKAKAAKSSQREAQDDSHCEKMPAPDTTVECAEDAAGTKAPARAPGTASKDAKCVQGAPTTKWSLSLVSQGPNYARSTSNCSGC
jgi:hypothetical protein